ncbi:MAG: LPS export ABC transporter permease LptG [Gammaproteobacteria bacterium]|nr:LPS export ABC transporter permease LptG [Gammaproteobacteria bacterium]
MGRARAYAPGAPVSFAPRGATGELRAVLPLILDWHIFRHTISATLVVVLAFVMLVSVFALIDELRGNYTFLQAATYVALTTPRRIYELLPFAAFLGTLLALGNLASRGELMVMRVSGVSVSRLLASLLLPLLVVIGLGYLVGEVYGPKLEEEAERYKTKERYSSDAIRIQGGYWYREGGLYMSVAAISEAGELLDIRQFWQDDAGNLIRTLQAASAVYVPGADAHWILKDITETVIEPKQTRTATRAEERWNGSVDPQMLSVRILVAAPKLSVNALEQQIEYMQREGLNARSYEVAYYTKLLLPLTILGFNFLAMVFVLGPMRQVRLGLRLTVGILVGLVFKYLQDLFAPMSEVYHLDPLIAVLIPIGLCWLLALWGARRFV